MHMYVVAVLKMLGSSRFRKSADDNRILSPAEGGGVGGFWGGEGGIDSLGDHATGEDLERLLFVGLGSELGEGREKRKVERLRAKGAEDAKGWKRNLKDET